MIFAAIETLQYIVVRPTDCKMKDRFIYRNKNLTIKFPSQAAFLEKCACLLSAILKDTGFVPTTIYGGRLSVADFQNDLSGTISDKNFATVTSQQLLSYL